MRTATSIEYKYSFWERHLASGIPPVWMEVGPVFDIHAPPGTVEAIHIPHFLCLGGTVAKMMSWWVRQRGALQEHTPTCWLAALVGQANL